MATLAGLTDANAGVTPGQFDAMVLRGELADVHVELIDGTMVFKMSQGRLHLLALALLNEVLTPLAREARLLVVTQGTIAMGDDRPEPDLALLDYDPRRTSRTPTEADVRLIVEIAVSSLAYDRRRKTTLYASRGIPEYWILNPVARQIEVYREPKRDSYGVLRVIGEEEAVATLALPESRILVADLLPMIDPADPLG